jgi:hypothetical protein
MTLKFVTGTEKEGNTLCILFICIKISLIICFQI